MLLKTRIVSFCIEARELKRRVRGVEVLIRRLVGMSCCPSLIGLFLDMLPGPSMSFSAVSVFPAISQVLSKITAVVIN